MLKVFFSDAGSLEQLHRTINEIEADALARLDALVAMASDQLAPGARFPARRHLNALTMRMQYEQESAVLRWTRWAREQVAMWPDTTDPGEWDETAVLRRLVTDHRKLTRS